ncbi:hypothetical protein [Microbispora sp. GKU 823]|uniref:hypothetical protein n=1 Tax=Microbispora sp. GKU 823 TaxID=1652100 RepID=UPI0009A2ABB3|nr:hypothetical protein [Microbispora sp. GKU 823]OPG14613.1 hypothetical protein B1L11_00040 [Microbispora sp. GKU 823]
MVYQLTMRRSAPWSAPTSPVDGIRVLALLPRRWQKDLSQVAGEIVIRISAGEEATSEDVHAEVERALASSEVSHLELVACRPLAAGPPK